MAALVLTFCCIAPVSFAIAWLALRPRPAGKAVVKRLNVIYRAHHDADVQLIELSQKPRSLSDSLGRLVSALGLGRHIATLLLHGGRSESTGFILLVSVTLAATGGVLGRVLGCAPAASCGAAVLLGVLPYLWLRRQAAKRLRKFDDALPDAIDLMARALRAGHSSGSSVEIIAEQSPAPLSDEFARCFQQQKFGIPFRDALLELGHRVPSRDLHFLITAILVQKETGGDLTQILDRTTNVIRERIRIEGEVRSYTAQGRLTGWILAALPVVMLLITNIMTPGYAHVLFTDPLGQKLMYAGVGLIAVGAFLIRRIVDVKV